MWMLKCLVPGRDIFLFHEVYKIFKLAVAQWIVIKYELQSAKSIRKRLGFSLTNREFELYFSNAKRGLKSPDLWLYTALKKISPLLSLIITSLWFDKIHQYNTRSFNSYYIPLPRTKFKSFSILYHGPKVYNFFISDEDDHFLLLSHLESWSFLL